MKVSGQVCGTPISWKVDTGAKKTFISLKAYKSIPFRSRPGLKPTRQQFVAANGGVLQCEGETIVELKFGELEVFFPVIVGGVTQCLLGEDFIRHFKCNFDHDERQFVICKSGVIQDCDSPRQRTKRFARVVSTDAVEVPPGCEISVLARFKDKPLSGDGILTPDPGFITKHSLMLARCVVNSEQSRFCARILNPGKSAVNICEGAVIGLFEPVKCVEQCDVSGGADDSVFHVDGSSECSASEELPSHLMETYTEGSQNLSVSQKEEFRKFLIKNQDVFARPGEIGRTNLGTHKIKLTDETPIKDPPRRVPLFKRDILEKEIDRLKKEGFIEKSDSPWSAQTVLVKKKDGSWRMCVDYRKLNEKTVKDAYPIPRIDDNLDVLSGAKWFTTLDCNMAYHQVPLEEEDKPKTAFATPIGGLYQFTTMPFGLCNAPATFQRIVEKALEGLQWRIAVLYLDDIIVYSSSFEEHFADLELIIERLKKAGLKLKAKKCFFFRHEISYLGYLISECGLKPDPSKCDTVRNVSRPRCVKEVRQFLGLTSYYRRFVKGYSEIARPIYDLTKANAKWNWDGNCETAFQTLKEKLTTAPVLAFPDVNGGQFILDCDASNSGIGAVLSQLQDGAEKVIAYASRTLSPAEQKYCVTRKEMLSVVFFTKYFRHYLLGRHFIIRTDHSSLRWLSQFKEPDGQVHRWLEQLSQFDYSIIHRPGLKHGNADFMSRVVRGDTILCKQCEMLLGTQGGSQDKSGQLVDVDQENVFNIATLYSVSEDELESDVEESDNVLTGATGHGVTANRRKRKRGRISNRPAQASAKPRPEIELTERTLREIQEGDSDLNFMLQLKESGSDKPVWSDIVNKSPGLKYWLARWELLSVHNGLLCIKWEHSEIDIQWRICIPSSLVPTVLWYLHDSHVSGHLGIKKTKEKAKRCPFYWIGINQTVADYVRACQICGEANNPQRKHRHLLQTYFPGGRFERIACDIAGPFPKSESGNSYILVVSDYFTKLTEMFAIPDIRAETVAEHIVRGWIKHYGCPRELHSDQGRQFVSAVFREICKLLEINKSQTTPLHPSSDGLVERMNRTVKSMLSKFVRSDQKDWDTYIDYIVMAYNTTPQESTGVSPHRLVYGEEMLVPLDIMTENIPENRDSEVNKSQYATDLSAKMRKMYELVRENLKEAACRQKKQYDCRVTEYNYSVGDKVWRNQWQSPPGIKASIRRHWTGPWMVVEKLCDVLFRIKHSATSPSVVIHGDNLKRYHGDRQLNFQVPRVEEREVQFPDLTEFAGENSSNDQQNECRTDSNGDPTAIVGHNVVTDASSVRQGEYSLDSSIGQPADQSLHSPLCQSTPYAHSSRSPASSQVAEQRCSTQTTCAPPTEHLAEQSDIQCSSPVAEQPAWSRVARANHNKHPAEHHVQSDHVYNHTTPIQSQTTRRSGREIKKPSHLKDYVCCVEGIMHQCDTCGHLYTLRRNLVRHVKEKHSVVEYWNCSEFGCSSRFIRRSYLSKHLMRHHGFSRLSASEKAVGAQRGDRLERYQPELEDVSEDETILDLLVDIEGLQKAKPPRCDDNNNLMDQYVMPNDSVNVNLQDLEDISDSELICAEDNVTNADDNVTTVSLCDEIPLCDDGAADVDSSEAETVIGGDYCGSLSGIDDVCGDDVRAGSSSCVGDAESMMGKDDPEDGDYSDGEPIVDGNDDDDCDGDGDGDDEMSVNLVTSENDESDYDELDYYDDISDGAGGDDDDDDSTDDADSDDDVVLISDGDNDTQTVAVPEIKHVVQSLTLTMRRTKTYSHGNLVNVETEYLWEGSQTSSTV